MSISASDLWPFLYILVAGWLATDLWRWLGVIAGARLKEDSELLNWVRAVATALVASVVAKQILFPGGALADSPLWLRIGAAVFGFLVFYLTGEKVIFGVATAILLLAGGLYLLG
jgi:branched-subunit amino acid transport protein